MYRQVCERYSRYHRTVCRNNISTSCYTYRRGEVTGYNPAKIKNERREFKMLVLKTIEYCELRQVLKSNVKKSCNLQLVVTNVNGSVARHKAMKFEYCNASTLRTIKRHLIYANNSLQSEWRLIANLVIDNVTYVVDTDF